ncbi:hypothetical protein J437_LFUL010798 [Ladona fulva]|uniref:Mos1 transposase HTH domain-containing protein n=1 Tax=Ladona fulva TaxID=123851 RepID=A0A8K0KT15_LADFU|nr:hypothetical protein J437_LFUL010798 [Ladona fulva]
MEQAVRNSLYISTPLAHKNVRNWCREFSEGRTEVDDEPRSRRPSLSDEVEDQIGSAIHEDLLLTVRKLRGRPKKYFGGRRMDKNELRKEVTDCLEKKLAAIFLCGGQINFQCAMKRASK